jgi:hypothetical protein
MSADVVSTWVDALIARHTSALTRSEFLKAVRALSARYVERRSELPRRPPADSPAKRAAFSAFYTPLHLITVREIVRALRPSPNAASQLVDLGCGTGPASAGWALAHARPSVIVGIDRHPWALDEAAWNWRMLGLVGRTRRADLVQTAQGFARDPVAPGTSLLAAWSVNELDAEARASLLVALLTLSDRGCCVLVIEPLARSAVPWWNDWTRAWATRGGQTAEWKLEAALPTALAALSDEAGFRRETLGARTLWVNGA